MRFCKGPNQNADEQDTGARTELPNMWLTGCIQKEGWATTGPGARALLAILTVCQAESCTRACPPASVSNWNLLACG